ncbi:HEPN domain-containing protein [Bacillus sp. 31A1R]|uniref:HEPN domain-containing protein n=1 Tax=Robertmurraya mangrovi TaxID=3098077 RepID=A0ABU5J464_9BACI|nr:HEPN domain-containing protein [Bacillus sp. 31A1R]MDZ5474167.1 HEPN domain-containing protein [Bacillus sp. 31A1R]
MGIKLLARISLPYLLRLSDGARLETKLPIDENFTFFKITFFPNKEDNDNYLPKYSDNICNNLEIECIVNKYDYKNYTYIDTGIFKIYDIGDIHRAEIFNFVREKLNSYLISLGKVTKMFWIEDLPLNPISGCIGIRTDFIFTKPDEVIGNARWWNTIQDDYMVDLNSKNIKPLDKRLLDRLENRYVVNLTWHTYFNKATKAMYSSETEEFIIYCAIAAESFIKQLITNSSDNQDVILNKLISNGRNNMVEMYFVVIMKYLYGVNLLEVQQGLYKNLKDIFSLRNDIMHNGYLDKSSLKKVGIEKLDYNQLKKYLSKLDSAIITCIKIASTRF